MTKRLIIDSDFVEKVKELCEKGMSRRQTALELKCSYATVQKIFFKEKLETTRFNIQPWTIEKLQELKDCYQTMPIRDLCLKFDRNKTELRNLLSHLGWEIPNCFFSDNQLDLINRIKELSTKCNQLEISRILNIPKSSIQVICRTNNIRCLTSHNNVNGETSEALEHVEEPKVEKPKIVLPKEEPKPKKTPQQLLAEAYREQADAIRNKLREQYK